MARFMQVPYGTGLAGETRFHKSIKNSYSTPPTPPPGRESMIEWRDIRSASDLNDYVKRFQRFTQEEQANTWSEMNSYLATLKELEHAIWYDKVGPNKDTKVKPLRRPKRSRRSRPNG